jgi:mannose-6-phosphate isomerase-like protein (cupin superfamily)
MRRIVTGHGADGRSRVVSDEELEQHSFGDSASYGWPVWGREDPPTFPDDGSRPSTRGPFPGVGGCRVTVMRLLPGDTEAFDRFVAGSLSRYADPALAGMHRTSTLDFDIVLSGHMILQLDDGEVELGPGDIVVQNGTNHRWENRSNEEVTMAVVLVGAHDAEQQ